MIIGECKERTEFYNEVMSKLLSKLKSLVKPYEGFLENNFPNYFLSTKFENKFRTLYIDYRCVKKTLVSLITDIIFANNKFDRCNTVGGYVRSFEIEMDDYKILISGIFHDDKSQEDVPFNCEVYIAKERWTDDGSHYIGADIMKFENLK